MFKLFTKTSSTISRSIFRSDVFLGKSIYSAPSTQGFHPIFNYCPAYSFSSNIPPPDNKGKEGDFEPDLLKSLDQADLLKDLEENILHETSTPSGNTLNGLSLDEFILFIQSKEAHVEIPDVYKSKAIYALSGSLKNRPQIQKITFDKAFWTTMYAIESLVWLPVTYFTYTSLSPIAAIVPAIAWVLTLSATRSAHKLMDNSVMRLDLEDNGKVILYSWGNQGKGVTCQIEGAVLTKVAKADNKEAAAKDATKVKKSAYIEVSFVEDSPKQRRVNAIFVVSADESPIENVNLFKDILNGRHGEISKYQHVPSVPNAEKVEKVEEKL